MFILAVKGFEEDGAFSLENDDGEKVLIMFEEEDDADRLCRVVRTPEAAVELARELNVDEAWVIGGRLIYKALDQHHELSVIYRTILIDSYMCDLFYYTNMVEFQEDGDPQAIDKGYIHKYMRVPIEPTTPGLRQQ